MNRLRACAWLLAAPLAQAQPAGLLAAAQARVDAGAPLCANGCAGVTAPVFEPARPGLRQSQVLGAVLGLGLGVALGQASEPAAGRESLSRLDGADAAVAGGALLLLAAPPLLHDDSARRLGGGAWSDCRGTDGALNGFDASVRSHARAREARARQRAHNLSWALAVAAVAQPVGLVAAADGPNRGRDLAVLGEAAALAAGANNLVKHVFHRPRPFALYCDPLRPADLAEEDAQLSFYSGHASGAFVAAAAAGTLADLHGYRNRKWIWASGLTLAGATGVLRIRADKHYASDVAVGTLAGLAFGVLVPRLHRAEPAPATARTSGGQAGHTPLVVWPVRAGRQAGLGAFVSGGFSAGGPSLVLSVRF